MGRKIWVDFDNTLTNSMKAMLKVMNMYSKGNDKLSNVPSYCLRWNASDIYPNLDPRIIPLIFDSKVFFDELEIFKGCKETLDVIKDYTQVHIVSICTVENAKLKADFIAKHFPYAVFLPIIMNSKSLAYKKDMYNMSNGILIDDRSDILESSNATHKIQFRHMGLNYEWTQGWTGSYATEWSKDFKYTLLSLIGA